MSEKFTRRDFMKKGMILAGGGIVAALAQFLNCSPKKPLPTQGEKVSTQTPTFTQDDTPTPIASSTDQPTATQIIEATQRPSPTPTAPPGVIGAKFPGRVVQVHHNDVHNWNYSDLNYYDFVDQQVTDDMFDQGMMSLTGERNIVDAWKALIPSYQAGQVVAIKVSFNNSYDDVGSIEAIDGIIEPVNAIIRGLIGIGVSPSSIVVYDSSRWIPKRFSDRCINPEVIFRHKNHDPWGKDSTPVTFKPPGKNEFTQQLSKEVAQANYLINVPVLKVHGMAKISLAMKNHYGSIERPNDLHQWSSLGSPDFSTDYNPIVEINNHPEIREKTILTVGDSLFAAFHNTSQNSFPQRWVTFNQQTPKSLFFATDPVAIDCVMGDLLHIEKRAMGKGDVNPLGFSYLSLAESVGLGVFERGDPWNNTYTKIDFVKHT